MEKLSPKDLTKEDLIAIEAVDKEIAKRTYYGIRTEVAKRPSVIISWSNGSASWDVYPGRIEPGTEVQLDANQVLAPYSWARMNRICDFLIEHPLYRASTEARDRGVSSPWEASITWVQGQLEKIMREELGNLRKEV